MWIKVSFSRKNFSRSYSCTRKCINKLPLAFILKRDHPNCPCLTDGINRCLRKIWVTILNIFYPSVVRYVGTWAQTVKGQYTDLHTTAIYAIVVYALKLASWHKIKRASSSLWTRHVWPILSCWKIMRKMSSNPILALMRKIMQFFQHYTVADENECLTMTPSDVNLTLVGLFTLKRLNVSFFSFWLYYSCRISDDFSDFGPIWGGKIRNGYWSYSRTLLVRQGCQSNRVTL